MEAHTCKLLLRLLLAVAALGLGEAAQPYYGKYIGKLKTLHHGVTGEVYAVDARTLHIRDFSYDGEGPAAFFWAGDTKSPSSYGFKVNDEKGTTNVLPRYRKKHITVTLPDNKTLRDIKWFSVWCDEFAVNFGDVKIPKNFDYPKPQKIDPLDGVHAVSSDNIVIVDAQTLLVPHFSYDGEAPDAKFWVGRGNKPSSQGTRVPDENGREEPLRRYDHKTLVLTLPADLTVHEIGHFGVWCEAFAVDFGHVRVPANMNVPPSLKMLGVSAQSKLNCEVLHDDLALEVRWAIAGDSIVVQLVGKVANGDYMAFGLSGHPERSRMVGGDVAVAWVDHDTLQGGADDYFLGAKSQCSGGTGSCPDERIREGTNTVLPLNAALVNGYSIVTFQRHLRARDELDLPVLTNQSQAVIWAVGPLNDRREVSFHHTFNKHNVLIDFGRSPRWNCPLPDTDAPRVTTPAATSITTGAPSRRRGPSRATTTTTTEEPPATQPPRRPTRPRATPAPVARVADAWHIPAIQCYEPEDGVFYAQMGPTGGKRGYSAITGHVGWGISWYINGLLIPEINVVRGKTYTFVVEGGLDPETPARYHPFYITDDPVGGYEHKTPEERAEVRIFAGVSVNRRGDVVPTGTGRLCNWTPDPDQPPADEFASFGAYQRSLTLQCDEGEPGVVQWTPGPDTPDTVYYQCFTHRYLGWKINVLDRCDASGSASEPVAASVNRGPQDPPAYDDSEEGELQPGASIRVSTRVKPNGVFYHNSKTASDGKGDAFEVFYGNTQDNVTPYAYSTIGKDDEDDDEDERHISSDIDEFAASPGKNPLAAPSQQASVEFHRESEKLGTKSEQHAGEGADAKTDKTKGDDATRGAETDVSRWKESYHSSHGELTPVDPMRRPVIHATTPYSLAAHTDRGAEVSSQAPLRTQDTLQELKHEPVPPTGTVRQSETPKPGNGDGTGPKIESAGANLDGQSSTELTTAKQTIPASKLPTSGLYTQAISYRPQQMHLSFRRPVPHHSPPHMHRPLIPAAMRKPYISTVAPQNYALGMKKHYYRTPNMGTYRPLVSSSVYQRPLTLYPSSPRTIPSMTTYQRQTTFSQRNVQRVTATPTNRLENVTKLPSLVAQRVAPKVTPPAVHVVSANKPQSQENAESKSPATFASAATQGGDEPSALMPAAVNTGFHPESVIVEGGFKPITQKNAAAQDRSSAESETLAESSERLDAELLSDVVAESSEESKNENPFKGQRPELFEPMFIPSPPDRIINSNTSNVNLKKPVSLPDDLIPPAASIHHRNSGQPLRSPPHLFANRPRPGNVRRPLYPNNNAGTFRVPPRGNVPSFRHQQKSEESQDETPMAAERLDTYYLPPVEYKASSVRNHQPSISPSIDATIAPGTVVTYDGKSVVDASLASSISNPPGESSSNYRSPSGTAALIRELPQFGPFRGEIPPPVPAVVQTENIPQLRIQNQKRAQTLPLHFSPGDSQRSAGEQKTNYPGSHSARSTRLSLVRQVESTDEASSDLTPEASEIKEFLIPVKTRKFKTAKKVAIPFAESTDELSGFKSEEMVSTDKTVSSKDISQHTEPTQQINQTSFVPRVNPHNTSRGLSRNKRSPVPHHEPGHHVSDKHDDQEEDRQHIHVEDMRVSNRGKAVNGSPYTVHRESMALILCLVATFVWL
ncbi:protein Skeletor, isoforms D/E-like [Schistocerca serialis cubense]|uniref:protein Skeletor, isoforms D/E-like n=1 Tax=Schistocerca serialis cubense TaxID=2023355 RepID=UPI00214E3127|nr:protein Skeletor, isoforms D/E-like [Schistocerca serialis cubense]